MPDATATLDVAARLYTLWFETAATLDPKENPSFDPPSAVVNWGIARIDGGEGEVVFDCRLLPGQAPSALLTPFQTKAEALAHSLDVHLEMTVMRGNPAMELNEPSELLTSARAACRDTGLSDTPMAKPTNTEAGVFAGAGVEAIVFGPGRSTGNAHTPNEHNLYTQMEKAIEFYRALITRLCAA
jgi:acetylornithine deacetylase/succinyl-diaminopimelate desuccinylase-like protein